MTKLRLLNAGGSAICYFAYLMGYKEVDVAMADPLIYNFCKLYMDKAMVTVPQSSINLEKYRDAVLERFSNPIGDQITRFCMDGTNKVKEFVSGTLKVQLDKENG